MNARQLRLEQRAMLFIGLAIPPFIIGDWLLVGRIPALALAARILWGGGLIALGFWLRAAPNERRRRQLLLIASGLCALCPTLVVMATRAEGNPTFYWMAAIPLAVCVLAQSYATATAASAVLTTVGAAMALRFHGGSWDSVLLLIPPFCASAVVAMYASFHYGWLREVAVAAERDRADAVCRLAESERQRAQSARLATVGILAAGVAHEINNPLAFVKSGFGYIREALEDRGALAEDEELRETAADVTQGLERIRVIVSDLREFARDDENVQPENCRIESSLADALRMVSGRLPAGASVEKDIAADLPPVRSNQRLLTQVFVNLLINAADALQASAPGLISIRAFADQGRVVVIIEDSGPGIPADVLPHIFDPFFTTKPPGKGTGLGLSLSREYVERFGGALRVESGEAGGARLRIDFPPAPEAPEPRALRAPSAPGGAAA